MGINIEDPMATGAPRNWYTPKEVAEDLGVNYMTVINALNEGTLPGIKIGKQWRIYHTVYIDLIRRGTVSSRSDIHSE